MGKCSLRKYTHPQRKQTKTKTSQKPTPEIRRIKKPATAMYNNKTFRSSSNTDNGEVSPATVFHYHQDGNIVWAEYTGGSIARGFLIATVVQGGTDVEGTLDARYEHVNTSGELMTGRCRSTPEVLADGRIRLHETWKWTSGDESSGTSVVEEEK
ncbi:homoserine kinase type II [Microdochium nivale]|nr:homoserine kinase type II [Microdochium nivale]